MYIILIVFTIIIVMFAFFIYTKKYHKFCQLFIKHIFFAVFKNRQ